MDRFMALPTERQKKRITMQQQLELKIEEYSIDRYWKQYENDPSSSSPEQAFIHEFIKQTAEPYRAWLDYFKDLKPQYQDAIREEFGPLFVLEPETLAAIVISELINTCLSREVLAESYSYRGGDTNFTFQSLAKQVGQTVFKICNYRTAKADFIDDWNRQSHFLKSWEPRRCEAFTRKFLNPKPAKRGAFEDLGTHLLNIAALADVIHKETRKVRIQKKGRKNYKLETVIALRPDIMDTLITLHSVEAFLKMVYRPMIVPPIEHTLDISGGPLDINLRKRSIDGSSIPAH
jgi:hypothetical protein